MGWEQVLKCDVYGTPKDVKFYRVRIEEVPDEAHLPPGECEDRVALCPRARKRLVHFIERGTTPPTPRSKSDG